MANKPFTIRWGILATGGIAQTFAKDLTISPATRSEYALRHTVVAAASSSGASRAAQFLKDVNAPSTSKAHGTYEELAADKDVDIIYIATPHSHHYQNAMLCLEAGKNVLCEKAFTVNGGQARLLAQKAREKNLFLMEAVWTRYFPISMYVRSQITSGILGAIQRVSADNSVAMDPYTSFADGKNRMVNLELAGGALLDLGIYSLTWVFQTLYLNQDEKKRRKPSVISTMKKFKTGADVATSMLLTFPREEKEGGDAQAIATTSMLLNYNPDGKGSAGPVIRVQGEKGEVQIWGPTFRPTRSRLVLTDGTVEDKEWPQPGPGKGSGFVNGFGDIMNSEGEGHGMFWEADEAGLALLEGRKEARFENLEESITIMDIMDEVRRQNGLYYPEDIESTEYPLKF